MKILEDALHGISSATMHLMSAKSLEAYREECRDTLQTEPNRDTRAARFSLKEIDLADKELARRRR